MKRVLFLDVDIDGGLRVSHIAVVEGRIIRDETGWFGVKNLLVLEKKDELYPNSKEQVRDFLIQYIERADLIVAYDMAFVVKALGDYGVCPLLLAYLNYNKKYLEDWIEKARCRYHYDLVEILEYYAEVNAEELEEYLKACGYESMPKLPECMSMDREYFGMIFIRVLKEIADEYYYWEALTVGGDFPRVVTTIEMPELDDYDMKKAMEFEAKIFDLPEDRFLGILRAFYVFEKLYDIKVIRQESLDEVYEVIQQEAMVWEDDEDDEDEKEVQA